MKLKGSATSFFALVLLSAAESPGSAAAKAAGPQFTVDDSIALTRVVGTPLFSPDRSHFASQTRRGDLARDVNVDSIVVYLTRDVERYANSPGSTQPTGRTIVEVDFRRDSGAVSALRWSSPTELAYIAEGDRGRNQVFVVDVMTAHVTELTHSDTDVVSFALRGDHVVYYALVAPGPRTVADVGERTLGEVVFADEMDDAPLALFHASRATGQASRLDLPNVRLLDYFRRIWVSPNGDYAVTYVPATRAPARWASYRIPFYDVSGFAADRVQEDPTSHALAMRTRYQLVDLRQNTGRPLLDAPSGYLSLNETPPEVFWPASGHSVIVSNTYVPLTSGREPADQQRAAAPAIVEVDLQSSATTVITWEPVVDEGMLARNEPRRRVTGLGWDEARERLTVLGIAPDSKHEAQTFAKQPGGWRRLRRADSPAPDRLSIELRQSLTERPKLYVVAVQCKCSRVLLDPNPQMEQFEFGRPQVFNWTDRNGIAWRGGLTYPVGFEPGHRYPLVVQTHGFDPEEFLIDGPHGTTTAMAAQPLAAAGFLVLQIQDNRRATTRDEQEAAKYAEGYRAAIEALVATGSADPDNVGLIAFSRTGLYAIRLLADHPDLLKAVNIADGSWGGYVNSVLLTVNGQPDLVAELRRLYGGMICATEPERCLARDALYQLPRARAAFRLEAIGEGAMIATWEMYGLLKNAKRPVDLVYFPQGSHVLQKPSERRESQGGTVDWFRFWLQGHESPDVAKKARNERWRQSRAEALAAGT